MANGYGRSPFVKSVRWLAAVRGASGEGGIMNSDALSLAGLVVSTLGLAVAVIGFWVAIA